MDSSKKYNNPSPEAAANILSKLFFCWTFSFFKYGYKNDLEAKDIYNTQPPDLSEPLGNILEKNWNKELAKSKSEDRKPSLMKAIANTFFKQYALYGGVLFIQVIILRTIHPLALAELINYFHRTTAYTSLHGWLFAVAVVVISFVNCIIMHHVTLGCFKIGMRCRIACCSLLYRKLLRLSKTALGKTASGQIVNLMSNDVQRFDIAAGFLHYLWIMPVQAVVSAFVMYDSVGYAAIIGITAMLLQAVLLQGYLSKLQGTLRFKIAHRTDTRVKLMSEITSGIQVIKMYAWEKPFEKVVQLARKLEIDCLAKTSYIRGFTVALMVFTERFTTYLTIIAYVLLGNPLTSDKVFSLAQFFNTIQLYMAIFFPLAMSTFAEAIVSVRRLEDFLLLDESILSIATTEKISEENTKGSIKIKDGRASWIPSPIIETLTNLNLNIKPGSLYAVVGSVGSGKSSLLQLFLKELPLSSGILEVNGNISYASQEPWLFVSSVRNNILFGQQFIRSVYSEVVKVCALGRDFEQFPQGDKTLVGERGVSLSGGQRARINLARAVYREADIYLLDDPLSAVDAHVGKELFEECIIKYLKGKTRILVTHQLQFLKQVDQIIIVDNGQIEKVGTFEELSENELSYLKRSASEEELEKQPKENEIIRKRLVSIASTESSVDHETENVEPVETQELMEKGAVSSSLYKKYFNAGAPIIALILLALLFIIAQMSSNAADLWVTYWTNNEEKFYKNQIQVVEKEIELNPTTIISYNMTDENSTDIENFDDSNYTIEDQLWDQFKNESLYTNIPEHSQDFYIYLYTLFIIGSIVLTTLRSLLFFKVCMKASKNLHNTMFSNLLRATMRFFDVNPSGRILTRFSKDMGQIDETLPRAMLDALQIFMVMSGILVMVFIVTPWMIVPAVLLAVIFLYIRIIFLASGQDVKRLESITRAPVFSHVSASLNGLTTIRSSKAQYMVSKEFDVLQDQHTASWYLFLITTETFGFYLDVICVIFLAVVTFQFLIFDDGKTLSGDVGLVISQSLILTGMLQHGIRQTAEVASQMTSVERVLQYSNIEQEGAFESVPTKKPHRDWPKNGEVNFKQLYLQYTPSEAPTLRNLNIEIKPGEKIGIVGRTGAGKSSLISALFRLAPIEGVISIDDIDTKEIGLHDLRQNISIIPQEPVLFSASLRHNLDPFDKCDDKTLWKALEDVELKDAIEDLNQEVTEGGGNFSAGQRQLICLARAIIRNNKILVLDEATANVDPQTDALIQKTIRKNFKNCTVLTIAHRLNTVMDSDKILVMDAGEAVEFDVPHQLLNNPDGYLTKMVKETGSVMEAKLKKYAEEIFLFKTSTISEENPVLDNRNMSDTPNGIISAKSNDDTPISEANEN
ncbi:ABC transporter transmembrane region [Popillia japonica]|uniref:ABC transporter transmembrane region n=1 Tax=Popillia japonica TaxID=7064 RepID=A0AAW1HUF2_POPJA